MLKTTPLKDEHVALGAKMVDFAGWLMPVEYRGLRLEHVGCRERVGLFDVSHMGEIRVRGTGALDTAQWLTSNDVGRLRTGQAQYSLLTNAEGGIVDDVIVYCLEPNRDYLFCVNASNVAKDFAWMSAQGRGRGAEITDESARWAQIAVQGPQALQLVSRVCDVAAADIPSFEFRAAAFGDESILIARTGYTGEDGVEVFVPPEAAVGLWRRLMADGEDLGVMPVGLGARDTLRTEMKYPLYGHELDDHTNPYAAGLGWVVKPDRKDFVGRAAIVAGRSQALNQRLVGFKMVDRGIPRHGYRILDADGAALGRVTSGTVSPSLNENIGVGYVTKSHCEIGARVFVEIRGRAVAAEVVKTPFVVKRPANA